MSSNHGESSASGWRTPARTARLDEMSVRCLPASGAPAVPSSKMRSGCPERDHGSSGLVAPGGPAARLPKRIAHGLACGTRRVADEGLQQRVLGGLLVPLP